MKKITIFSILIATSLLTAKPIIIKADSLKCNNDKQSIKHDIVVDIDEDKCLESKYILGLGPSIYKKNVSFKIKDHDITCWPKEGSEVQTQDKVLFKLPDDIKVLNSTDDTNSIFTVKSVPIGYKKNEYTLAKHREYIKSYGDGQKLKTSFKIVGKNIIPVPSEEYLNEDKPFAYFTNPNKPHSTERIYQYINKSDQENIEKIKPINQFNQVSSLTCGDHQISRLDVSSDELPKDYKGESKSYRSSKAQ